ncbi:radical SAM family heme chaperone HemW [Kurthia senegalensis]|uniref:radical SAM family heme chaperone HemW n=1 Tax=Kurthia senegalensis TaxID=1033740 RepID=UPI0002896D85|nr:radical SAM family heme chaperone HemW [Kurthia senegalensis]
MVRGIYIHIPFCHQICNYCDFNKVFFKNQPVDEYIEAIGQEMRLVTEKYPEAFQKIETVFLGGGTPTSLSAGQLENLLRYIRQYIPLDQVVEFSSEANPDELTREKLEVLYKYGVNRLSIGVQSFDQEILKKLGRTHSNEHVFETIQAAREVGFTNISIDLMYGLPGQTIEQWQHTLDEAFKLNLPHFSAYSLIVEPKTIFYNLMNKGKLQLPGEDLEAEMYEMLMQQMESNGLMQYEISNFAKRGLESVHNCIYWENDEYAGFGAGASGYLNGVRYTNLGPLKKYMAAVEQGNLPLLDRHEVPLKEKVEEEMFLGLRKIEGVSITHFKEKFNVELDKLFAKQLQLLVEEQLLLIEGDSIKLTYKGRFVGNEVFQQFLLD